MERLETINGLGELHQDHSQWSTQVRSFRKIGIKPITVRDTAYLRLNSKYEGWTRTCHTPIYAKSSQIVLAMMSPLVTNLRLADRAVEANRNGNHFTTQDTEIYDRFAKQAEDDRDKEPEKRKAIFLPEKGVQVISANSDEARTLFQDQREEYFERFAPKEGIKLYPIGEEFVDSQKGTTIGYMWFYGPDYDSVLYCRGRGLDYDNWAFGVKKTAAGTKKIKEVQPYSQKELKKHLNSARAAIDNLEQVISFLERFKK